ncbi:LADA_0G07558g1_1 [Lachancea dasiensis]|uniref:LADA_0G07558g1_1 n=1 Tax=Lachancea dasiensis TaxID=1072105 RepID=A0A1G4JTM5_9SACH|nr:LADA_0G07558g1_1 [Lachancea dasiensis]
MDVASSAKQESPPQLPEANRIDIGETIGGSQTRKYLNERVTPALLRGMRLLAKDQPEDPLRALGEYLIQESQQQASSVSAESNASSNN